MMNLITFEQKVFFRRYSIYYGDWLPWKESKKSFIDTIEYIQEQRRKEKPSENLEWTEVAKFLYLPDKTDDFPVGRTFGTMISPDGNIVRDNNDKYVDTMR